MLLPLWRTAYAAAPMAMIDQYLAVLFLYPTSVVALFDSIIRAKDWLLYPTYTPSHTASTSHAACWWFDFRMRTIIISALFLGLVGLVCSYSSSSPFMPTLSSIARNLCTETITVTCLSAAPPILTPKAVKAVSSVTSKETPLHTNNPIVRALPLDNQWSPSLDTVITIVFGIFAAILNLININAILKISGTLVVAVIVNQNPNDCKIFQFTTTGAQPVVVAKAHIMITRGRFGHFLQSLFNTPSSVDEWDHFSAVMEWRKFP